MRKALTVGAGLAAAGGLLAFAKTRKPQLADSDLYGQAEYDSEPRQAGNLRLLLPAEYHRSEAVHAIFTADAEAVRASLPGDELRPVMVGRGRCAYVVAALRHHETSVRGEDGLPFTAIPYGELAIGPLVTTRRGPTGLALMRRGPLPNWIGLLVQHMPVTTREARDLGRAFWGYAKFVADMEFAESADERRVTVAEGGEKILELSVASRGGLKLERTTMALYSVLDGQLIRTPLPTLAYTRRRMGGASLVLGTHAVADDLRRLDVSSKAIAVEVLPLARLLLPIGEAVANARAMDGYAGTDRERGRYVVSYPGLGAIDLYATRPDVSPVSGAWSAEMREPSGVA